jgi:hypothetical protein
MDQQDSEQGSEHGLSRRSLLKRGAVVGVAAAWTVPLVQAVSMSPASAASPSEPNTPPTGGPTDGPSTRPHPTETPTTPTSATSETTVATTSSSADAASVVQNSSATDATGALAFTGTDMPVGPTVVAGIAAIAVGAGALAAGRARAAHRPTHAEN